MVVSFRGLVWADGPDFAERVRVALLGLDDAELFHL
jgi:hypothetical protein